MLVEVRVPKLAASSGSAYVKAHRRAQDWATVAVAAVVHRSNGGIDSASVTLTNMGATPLRARGVEEALAGGASVSDAAARAADGTVAAERSRRELGVPHRAGAGALRPGARAGDGLISVESGRT